MSILVFGDEQDFHNAVAKASEKFNSSVEHAESSDVAGDFFDAIMQHVRDFSGCSSGNAQTECVTRHWIQPKRIYLTILSDSIILA